MSLPYASTPHRLTSPPSATSEPPSTPAGARRRLAARGRPLLSVDEAAVLLGCNRSSVYRSIGRGDFPLPVFRLNGRYRITRASVERFIADDGPPAG